MRLVDTSKGELSFAYFDTNNSMNFKHVMLTEKDGVYIKIKSDSVVKITYKDKSVYFKLPPQKEDKPENANLLPEEEFIARVQDESGLRFLLLFNSSTKSFYYMLNPEQPMTENVKDMGENLFLGERTKYVYYEDTALHRKILIGVNSYNIMDNNYYDGPFDQFPPYLEIRDKMYKAYPYTQYMKGLDPNGNFLDFEGSRVAISSYVNYYADDLSEIKDVVKACTKDVDAGKDLAPSIFLSCLTYESKKDFHKTIPEFFKADGTLLPQKGI
jgi:hypothetical protein